MPEPLPIQFVHHISHITGNLEESRAFYRDVLGFREIQRPNFSFAGAWLFNYGVQVHLIAATDEQAVQPTEISTRADHIAFYVEDTNQAQQMLEQRGIPYRSNYVADTNVMQLFFQDPDGNHIELGTYPPIQEQ